MVRRKVVVLCLSFLLLGRGVTLTGDILANRLRQDGVEGGSGREESPEDIQLTLGAGPGGGLFQLNSGEPVLALTGKGKEDVDGAADGETDKTLGYIEGDLDSGDSLILENGESLLQVQGEEGQPEESAPAPRREQPLPSRGEEAGKLRGEKVPWEDMDVMIPVGSVTTLVDVDTGISFQAQRRGGSKHMDMEPLTPDDTAKMRTIYQGSWSWERRAVVIKDDGKLVAASINGMPHGQQDNLENDFAGHFCLHFLGSALHSTGKPDPGHQKMIRKAAKKQN